MLRGTPAAPLLSARPQSGRPRSSRSLAGGGAASSLPAAPQMEAIASGSGVGGALLAGDECGLVRLCLSLATLRLQVRLNDRSLWCARIYASYPSAAAARHL